MTYSLLARQFFQAANETNSSKLLELNSNIYLNRLILDCLKATLELARLANPS